MPPARGLVTSWLYKTVRFLIETEIASSAQGYVKVDSHDRRTFRSGQTGFGGLGPQAAVIDSA
jgi:hypothetical protein